MGDYDLGVVWRRARRGEGAIDGIEDQLPAGGPASVEESRGMRSYHGRGWRGWRGRCRWRENEAARWVSQPGRAGRREDQMPKSDVVVGIKDGVVHGTGQADGVIRAVVDRHPLPV